MQLSIEHGPAQWTSDSAPAFFKTLAQERGLAHVAYYAHTIPGRGPDDAIIWTTYSPEWVVRYFQNAYFRIDPVVAVDRTSVLPVDWNELNRTAKPIKRFFGEAAEFGVGRNGLAIPVRGPCGDRAIFAVTSNESDVAWSKTRVALMRDLVIIAQYVHQGAMTAANVYGLQASVPPLAPRVVECLRWAAAGKTAQDVSVILNLSERCVRAYLDTARHKLNALNIAHAVSRALALGLIPPG